MLRKWVFLVATGINDQKKTKKLPIIAYTLNEAWGKVTKHIPLNTFKVELLSVEFL
jgi:hypothetical protein